MDLHLLWNIVISAYRRIRFFAQYFLGCNSRNQVGYVSNWHWHPSLFCHSL